MSLEDHRDRDVELLVASSNTHTTLSLPSLHSPDSLSTNSINSNNKIAPYRPLKSNSLLGALFRLDNDGLVARKRFCLLWGICVISVCITTLRYGFGHTYAESFFIAATTVSTIGYGPVLNSNSISDHYFLSLYFILGIFPFAVLQAVSSNDTSHAYAKRVQLLLKKRLHKDNSIFRSYRYVFSRIILEQAFYFAILIFTGVILFHELVDVKYWINALYYSISTASSIGYGSFKILSDAGFYIIGCYALICQYVVFMHIIPKLATLWLVLGYNTEIAY